MTIKRLGLPIALLIVAILSIEVLLTILRQREITVTFSAESAALAALPENTDPTAAETTTDEPLLTLTPDGKLSVTVAWSYQIGPRFPTTTVHAVVQSESGETVAERSLSITCANPLGCSGSQVLDLSYGVRAEGDAAAAWQIGRYSVQVTRTYSGQQPIEITSRRLTVINP
jgi:hypothetical protein